MLHATDPQPALTLEPLLDETFGWCRLAAGSRTFWFRGAIHGRTKEALAREAAALTPDSVAAWLDGLDGHFSLIVIAPDFSLAAVDPVRGYPLIWAQAGDHILVSHDGPALCRRMQLGPADIDPAQADAFVLGGGG